MSEVAKVLPFGSSSPFDDRVPKDIKTTYTDEVIFALCGPIGSPIHETATEIVEVMTQKYRYECQIIRLSDFILNYMRNEKVENPTDPYESLKTKIDQGDKMRETYGNAILVEHAIYTINKKRVKISKTSESYKPQRICYIIDSLKNMAEYEILKEVYRDVFYTIGIFADTDKRVQKLSFIKPPDKIHELIERDADEKLIHGQAVKSIFQLSDYFINVNFTNSEIRKKIERFMNIIFSTDIVTPTIHETAMYMAASAAGKSGCLSRQVGACLTDSIGNVLSVGWNDVPKANGGVYTCEDTIDNRCYNHGGICSNDHFKGVILEQIVDSLIASKLFLKPLRDTAIQSLRDSAIKINDLIEFSRSIHAEMLAIIRGAINSGSLIMGGKLFTTTYPCHYCAKHIIAAGIKEVYYIEPYGKSQTMKLHQDSISEDRTSSLVNLIPFEGVSPKKYFTFFKESTKKRKLDSGKRTSIPPYEALPIERVSLASIPLIEGLIVNNLITKKAIEVPPES